MAALKITIPESIIHGARLPRKRMKEEICKELALQLYREGILSFSSARKLAGMEKMAFHFLLGQREIPRSYDEGEYQEDLKSLKCMDSA